MAKQGRIRTALAALRGAGSPNQTDQVAHVAGSLSSAIFGDITQRIGTYKTNGLDQATYDQMMRDPQVALASELRKLTLLTILGSLDSKGSDPVVREYVMAVLRPIMPAILRYCADQGTLRGTLPAELVWENASTLITYVPEESPDTDEEYADGDPGDPNPPATEFVAQQAKPLPDALRVAGGVDNKPAPVNATVQGWRIAKFKPLSLTNIIAILQDGLENFAGFRVVTPSVDILVEDAACFLYSHNLRTSYGSYMSWFGEGDLERVYDAWFRKQVMLDAYSLYLQRLATPPTIVSFPQDRTTAEGPVDTNQKRALGIVDDLMNGGSAGITLPKTDDATAAQWDVVFASVPDAGMVYERALDRFNGEIFHGLIMTDKMATADGATGSYALAETHLDAFIMGVQGISEEILSAINKQLVPQIVNLTFGPDVAAPEITSAGLMDRKQEIIEQLLVPALRSGKIDFDYDALATMSGLPIKGQQTGIVVSDPLDPSKGTAAVDASETTRKAMVELAEAAQAVKLELASRV